jgi:hypothetical protein
LAELVADLLVDPLDDPLVDPLDELLVDRLVDPLADPLVDALVDPLDDPLVDPSQDPDPKPSTDPRADGDPGTATPQPNPQLFLVVLGGRTAQSQIELHDVRFVAGLSLEDTIPELRRQWFGRREGLHLDSYMAVRAIDGYAVGLGPEPPCAQARAPLVRQPGRLPPRLPR